MNPTTNVLCDTQQKRCYICKQVKACSEFNNNRTRHDGKNAECRSCQRLLKTKYKGKNRLKTKAMRIAGVSHQCYEAALLKQQGVCAICEKPETGRNQFGLKRLAVDHDHKTGKFRGLLCATCNSRLSFFDDEIFFRAACRYLGRLHISVAEEPVEAQ